jgi:hypothetical protein
VRRTRCLSPARPLTERAAQRSATGHPAAPHRRRCPRHRQRTRGGEHVFEGMCRVVRGKPRESHNPPCPSSPQRAAHRSLLLGRLHKAEWRWRHPSKITREDQGGGCISAVRIAYLGDDAALGCVEIGDSRVHAPSASVQALTVDWRSTTALNDRTPGVLRLESVDQSAH